MSGARHMHGLGEAFGMPPGLGFARKLFEFDFRCRPGLLKQTINGCGALAWTRSGNRNIKVSNDDPAIFSPPAIPPVGTFPQFESCHLNPSARL